MLESGKHPVTYLVTVWSVQPVRCQAVITGYQGGQWLPPLCHVLLRMAGALPPVDKGLRQVLYSTKLLLTE